MSFFGIFLSALSKGLFTYQEGHFERKNFFSFENLDFFPDSEQKLFCFPQKKSRHAFQR